MNKSNTLEQKSVYLISLFLTVVSSSCSSQRIQQEQDMMRMPLFAGCNPSFRNSLGVLFNFITTVIFHSTFLEVTLLIYLFHCFGKSPQSVPT